MMRRTAYNPPGSGGTTVRRHARIERIKRRGPEHRHGSHDVHRRGRRSEPEEESRALDIRRTVRAQGRLELEHDHVAESLGGFDPDGPKTAGRDDINVSKRVVLIGQLLVRP